jgi:glycerol-3-phosphate acyltransferase PlsX
MNRQGLSADEQHLVAGVLNEVKKGFDVEDRGGAPLLGVGGNVFIGHGSSSADAVEQMVYSVRELVDADIVGALQHTFAVDA